MHLGIDFDNTIICYDQVIYHSAIEQNLVPQDIPISKQVIRDHIRKIHGDFAWTKMQAITYGKAIQEAKPFEGVNDFFLMLIERRISWEIISMKRQFPDSGDSYDLREAALNWLNAQPFMSGDLIKNRVTFADTQEGKLEVISEHGCTHFIDDLVEIFRHPNYSREVVAMLFDPHQKNIETTMETKINRYDSWKEMQSFIAAIV